MSKNRPRTPEVVVTTRISAGVGRATTPAFAKRGARIGLLAHGQDRLEAVRHHDGRLGGHRVTSPAEAADADAVEAVAGLIARQR